jgi:hypothetical protein
MVGLTQGCNHGCPFLPAPDHAVSLFLDAMWPRSGVQQSVDRFIFESDRLIFLDKMDNYRQVWDNATL